MAELKITVSNSKITEINQAKKKAGFDTLEQFVTAVVNDQCTNKKVIDAYAKANQVAAKKAAADAKAENKAASEQFRKAQRDVKEKAEAAAAKKAKKK